MVFYSIAITDNTTTYKVTVETANNDAETTTSSSTRKRRGGANFFIRLFGEERASEVLLLKSSRSKAFKELSYDMESLGTVKKLRVWHDRSGNL